MKRFEKEEAEEEAERKALLEKPEGDDGFVTVTYKRKRGRHSSGNHGLPVDGGGAVADGAKKKRKGAGELSDFYRFQVGVDVSLGVHFDVAEGSLVTPASLGVCPRKVYVWWRPFTGLNK